MDIFEWPDKQEIENYNIQYFIKGYKELRGVDIDIVEDDRENPDFVCVDRDSGQLYGVEVTSVYRSDRSVPDQHIPFNEGTSNTISALKDLNDYFQRVKESILGKISKAENYDKSNQLILSIYLGEYAFISNDDLIKFYNDNKDLFSDISPFQKIALMTAKRYCLIKQPS